MDDYVLDLRGNLGGVLDGALQIAALFLQQVQKKQKNITREFGRGARWCPANRRPLPPAGPKKNKKTVRGNLGGVLDGALQIAALFLQQVLIFQKKTYTEESKILKKNSKSPSFLEEKKTPLRRKKLFFLQVLILSKTHTKKEKDFLKQKHGMDPK